MKNDASCHHYDENGREIASHHSEKFKQNLSQRLARIEGQVRGIKKMVLSDVYCDDILNQISAVQSAISSAGNLLLEQHIKTCVAQSIQKGEQGIIEELMSTIRKMTR